MFVRRFARSAAIALVIAAAIQCFAVGFLAPFLPREFFLLCQPAVEEYRTLTFPAENTLLFEGTDGSVTVNAAQVTDVTVDAVIRAYAPSPADIDRATAYARRCLLVSGTAGVLRVVTEPEDRPDPAIVRIDCTLTVPVGTNLTIQNANGNIRVGEGCGNIAVNSNNADIQLAAPRGVITARNTNGRIRLLDAPTDATLETVNGNISAYMEGGKLTAHTANGHIIAALQSDAVLACDLETMNGGITVTMGQEFPADVTAETENGIVKTDFAVLRRDSEDREKRQALRGVIIYDGKVGLEAAAPADLKMHARNGNIWITGRNP